MPIPVEPYVEPLTRAAEKRAALIIPSTAYRQIVADLELYVMGDIEGRSFLIAGHRGSGKTTMVRKAIEEVTERCEAQGFKPLFVPLHGPSVLEPPKPAPPADPPVSGDAKKPPANGKAAPAATDAKPPEKAEEKEDPEQQPDPEQPSQTSERSDFLDRVVSGLWAATAQEFSRAMWEYAEGDLERLEMAAQFRVDLDRPPQLDRLRACWADLGALRSGVLFPHLNRTDQGVREIAILFRLGRASRPIFGDTKASQETIAAAASESSLSLVTIDGKSLLHPLIGLASGALVWNALPAADQPLLAAFTSTLTGLGAVLALKWTESRSQTRTQTWTDRFVPRDDAQSLYRVLPELVQSLRDAGLCPVFVVDELDKVPELHLDRQLDHLLGYLKQFVTERAFFCFLTDRAFYESNEQQSARDPYGVAYTRFGDRLFVRYAPNDIHEFLDDLIPESAELSEGERTARVLLRYIVLHRSYMHPYDLRRILARWTRDGHLALDAGDVISRPTFQRDVLMEVAVELMLRKPSLQEYLADPAQAQIALDALYFPSRCWRELKQDFDTSGLKDYLQRRIGPPNAASNGDAASGNNGLVRPNLAIRPDLLGELGERIEELMGWLVHPALLAEEAQLVGLSEPVLRFVESAEPLAQGVGAGKRFRWLRTPEGARWPESGRSTHPLATAIPPEEQAAFENDKELLAGLAAWLQANADFGVDLELLERTRILRTPPEWSYVKEALSRAGRDKERELDDQLAIRSYAAMLRDRRSELERALVLAGFGRLASKSHLPPRRTEDALRALSESLVHEASHEALFPDVGLPDIRALALPDAFGKIRTWAEGLSVTPDYYDLEKRSWDRWFRNFHLWWTGVETLFPFDFTDYLLSVRDSGPPSLLIPNLEAMSVYQWSHMLTESKKCPNWLAGSAWHALGFDSEALRALEAAPPETEQEVVRSWASRLAATPPGEAWLFVVADLGFGARYWDTDKKHPAIAVRKSSLSFIPARWSFTGALVELAGSPDEIKVAAALPFPEIPAKVEQWAYFGTAKLPRRSPDKPLYLHNPRSVSDAVTKLRALSQRQARPRRSTKKKDVEPAASAPVTPTPLEIGYFPTNLVVGHNEPLPLHASKGAPPYTWDIVSGGLPPGLTLDRTGAITGTPTSVGVYLFTARATDTVGNVGDRTFTVTVRAAPA